MKAAVRHFISPDIDLSDFNPADPRDFSFLLQALIGPVDSEGEESLQFVVCTPRHLERRLESEDVIMGRSLVIVNSTDVQHILRVLTTRIERSEAETWSKLTAHLARLGIAEFEDYL
ncbi:Imm8 family immunity protein [Actinacidiphila paucisporea]|uniref:Imm8 family immunity protein n=1 Tax=Actinacidiphila paucisporea TaxID=310782 RepID=UPI000936B312|nr:Imm8 family immunity protein [Actinacidiphila paucisporea]